MRIRPASILHGLGAGLLVAGASLGLALGPGPVAGASTGTLTLFAIPNGGTTNCSSSAPCAVALAAQKAISTGNTDVVTIHLAPGLYHAGGITLDSGTSVSLTMAGAGTSGPTASILDASSDTLVLIAEGTHPVTISSVAITQGTNGTTGGCLQDYSPLMMDHVTVSSCEAGAHGGGIAVFNGHLHLSTSTLSGDTADTSGGAIFVAADGSAVLTGDTLVTDSASAGGGLASYGTVQISNSGVVTCTATDGGGILATGPTAVLHLHDDSLLTDTAETGSGGDLDLSTHATAVVTSSTITGGAAEFGGGIYASQDSHLTISSSDVSNDSATYDGAGIGYDAGSNGTVSGVTGTTDVVTGQTYATGGFLFASDSTVTVTNSTITHDAATYGGGVGAEESTVTMKNDTFEADHAELGGGGVGSFITSEVFVSNSIFDHSTCDTASFGVISDNGYNVASTASCTTAGSDVKTSATIGLGPLAANTSSGPETMAITPKSSAFEVVPAAACTIKTTERGLPRPGASGKNCDAGAYEYQLTGYDMVGSDGGVFVFNPPGVTGGFFGSLPGIHVVPNKPVVGMVPTVTDQGYFLVASDGGVFAFGNAPFLGSLPGIKVTPALPITGIVAADTDKGYFLVGQDGGVYAFGTVPFLGSLPGTHIVVNNIIGIAATPTGNGYWLVSATGTVYAFGAAKKLGSATNTTSPVSAIAGTPTGGGYWITTQNGAVYTFGNAAKLGTLPSIHVTPNLPVIGIVRVAATVGYWLIGSDGGIFAFGTAPFVGSLPGVNVHVNNIVGAVPN